MKKTILTFSILMSLACGGLFQNQQAEEARLAEETRLAEEARLNTVYPMKKVNAGTYTIGCTPGQGSDCDDDETKHDVILTQSYLVGETEVTQGLYQEVMGTNPSWFTACGSECPVETVSWFDAVAFSNALSEREGLPTCYAISGEVVTMPDGLHCGGFRLPTEAEWEVAARGGQDLKYSGSNNIDEAAWYGENSSNTTHPVRQKKPNGFGLYDMSGNVLEWCWDWYGSYGTTSVTDPLGPDVGSDRVKRGGSWNYSPRSTRAAFRYSYTPSFRYSNLGLRLIRSSP